MKKYLLILISFMSLSAHAFKEGDLNILTGVGLFGTRGLIGFSGENFFTENHAGLFAVGIDYIGATSTVGYRYFSGTLNNSKTAWDKCFFLFDCNVHVYAGPSIQYAGGSTVKISTASSEREYETGSKVLGLVAVGFRDVFKNNLTLDTEISYRHIFSGGSLTQTAGPVTEKDKADIEAGYRSMGLSIALGYLF